MFQRLFGKWKVWQIAVLVALVAGMVAVTATITVAGMVCKGPASMATRNPAAASVAGPDASIHHLSLNRAGHS